ncbi:MAG: preprotein translocase subunit YajC [Phycisphaerales bacterium]|nr:preprotein translocase subunit YajC [Phycisphaerales bacterium]
MTHTVILAQTQPTVLDANGAPAPATRPEAPIWASPMVPLILIAVVFYLFIFRSKRKDDRKRKDMLSELKKGDRVQTIGGILGTVVEARDTEILVKVDESSNAKIRFSRSAIHRVIEEEKSEK